MHAFPPTLLPSLPPSLPPYLVGIDETPLPVVLGVGVLIRKHPGIDTGKRDVDDGEGDADDEEDAEDRQRPREGGKEGRTEGDGERDDARTKKRSKETMARRPPLTSIALRERLERVWDACLYPAFILALDSSSYAYAGSQQQQRHTHPPTRTNPPPHPTYRSWI
jgi:hypothetical protein